MDTNYNKGQDKELLNGENEFLGNDKTDNRAFLTDDEFEALRYRLEFLYVAAGRMFPYFNPEKYAITNEQINKLMPFLMHSFTPYNLAQEKFEDVIDTCYRKNCDYSTEISLHQ